MGATDQSKRPDGRDLIRHFLLIETPWSERWCRCSFDPKGGLFVREIAMRYILTSSVVGTLAASSVGCAVEDSARALSSFEGLTILVASVASPVLELPVVEVPPVDLPGVKVPGGEAPAIEGQADAVECAWNVGGIRLEKRTENIGIDPIAAAPKTVGALWITHL